jgi:hypothetical protein
MTRERMIDKAVRGWHASRFTLYGPYLSLADYLWILTHKPHLSRDVVDGIRAEFRRLASVNDWCMECERFAVEYNIGIDKLTCRNCGIVHG